jgi:hypothetical protein
MYFSSQNTNPWSRTARFGGLEDLFLVPEKSQPDFDFGQPMAGLAVAQNRRPIACPTCKYLW